jgi:electron transport complex protein RnfC
MSTATATKAVRGSFAHGIHPDDRKGYSRDAAIEVLPAPELVRVPLLQHIGAPCEIALKARSEVALGDVIGKAGGFVSAPIHASIAGKTAKDAGVTLPNGRRVRSVPVKAEGDQLEGAALFDDVFGGTWPTEGLDSSPEEIAEAVQQAGIVGLGGAAFPTHVKLRRQEGKTIHTLIVNGCECEPYLTSDFRLMVEAPQPIISGALLAARAVGADEVVIAVEDNKPAAVETLRGACEGTPAHVIEMPTKYPMGGERQLIRAATGLAVPTGGLPLDVGIVVVNVGTSAAIARAVLRGKPLTHRIVSVSGAGIETPKNLLVPIGAAYSALIAACGGLRDNAARVVAGGPMMGFALGDLDAPVTKGTSGLTVLTHDDLRRPEETTCVRCGRCVDVCPVNLVPTKIALAARHKAWDLAKDYHIGACIECGCCAYGCPASIPLTQLIRMGKAEMPRD